jgi:hypothetical protein
VTKKAVGIGFSLLALGLLALVVSIRHFHPRTLTGPESSRPGFDPQHVSKHSVSISWDASRSPNVAYYKVYRGTVTGGPYDLIETHVTSTAYVDSAVYPGVAYYYVTTTVSTAGSESAFSNEFRCVIPSP